MTIKSGRGDDYTTHVLDTTKCSRCGLCVKVCKADVFKLDGRNISISHGKTFGCTGCARCAAVCPEYCIQLRGRSLSDISIVDLPKTKKPSYESLYALTLARQNIHEFKETEVPSDLIEKIVAFAATAPVEIPPSNVELLVLAGHDKVRKFAFDIIDSMRKTRWMFSPVIRQLLRPLMTKHEFEAITTHLLPLIHQLEQKKAEGADWLAHSAPLAIYCYSANFTDPIDCQVAATYAMLAGETLGLGTVMLGSVAPFVRYDQGLRTKYNLPFRHSSGVLVLFGYPAIAYSRAVNRPLGAVRYY